MKNQTIKTSEEKRQAFGRMFKTCRVRLDLKQNELAEEFNKVYGIKLSVPEISQYENGKRMPEMDLIIDFSHFFDVTTDYLLGESQVNLKNVKSAIVELFKLLEGLSDVDQKEAKRYMEYLNHKSQDEKG